MRPFLSAILLGLLLSLRPTVAVPSHYATSLDYAAVNILFTGPDGNVYMMDANGNNRVQLTSRAGQGSSITYPWYEWSPDHKYILLVRSQANAGSDLLLLNQNGNVLSTLTTQLTLNYPAFYPNWAVDDDVILYAAAEQGSGCQTTVYVERVNLAGIQTPLWKYPAPGCYSSAIQTPNPQAWSLANNELPGFVNFIMYWSVRRQYAVYFGDGHLQVTNWQTGATAHFPPDVYDVLPSPSGSIIAEVSDNKVVLYRNKPYLTVQGSSPAWSPDSRFLYVLRCQASSVCAIFRVGVGHGHATQVMSWQNAYSFGPLHVTPDGQAIIFSRVDVTGPQQAQISIQRLDSSGLTTLATNAARPAL